MRQIGGRSRTATGQKPIISVRVYSVGAVYCCMGTWQESGFCKAAYYRLAGYNRHTEITAESRRRVIALGVQERYMGRSPHNIAGWAKLMIRRKRDLGTGFPATFRNEVNDRATAIYANW